jgi:hypothetical protein
MRKWFGLRRSVVGLTAVVAALVLVPLAIAGAINTSTDPGLTVNSQTTLDCVNGPPGISVNCNIYQQKEDVFLSGSPIQASLGTGTYYFAVVDPSGQRDPNPGAANLLSSGSANPDREFSIDSTGTISDYPGSHFFDSTNSLLSVFPYDNTTNSGGVYILAVCKISDTTGDYTDSVSVKPSDCKYDAFKVLKGPLNCDPNTDPTCVPPPASDLVVTKDAAGKWARDYEWSVSKKQTTNSNPIDAGGSSTNVAYKVQATWSVNSDTYTVGGTIHVNNPNSYDVTGVDVTDAVYSDTTPTKDNNISCTVDTGSSDGGTTHTVSASNGTIPAKGTVDYPYSCTVTGTPSGTEYNQATATADASNALPDDSATSNFVDFTWPGSPTSTTNSCTTVSDKWSDTNVTTQLGNVCVNGTATAGTVYTGSSPLASFNYFYDVVPFTADNPANTWTFTYTRAVPVTANQCVAHNNTATVTDGGTGSTDDDSTTDDDTANASVTVCGHIVGGLTMGFWQNKNGQSIITAYSGTNCQALVTWLKQFNPFNETALTGLTSCGTDAALTGNTKTTPSGVAGYIYNVIKAATCSGPTSAPCNAMLKAQMLATALDVYFSDATLGGNRINAPAALGGLTVDLTNICKMIDGSGGGSCSGSYENAKSAFITGTLESVPAPCNNPSPGANSMTILCMLWNAASNAATGGTPWYGTSKTLQVLAKDAFDSINNGVAFA